MSNSEVMALMAGLGLFLFVFAAIGIGLWVIYGIGLSSIAKKRGLDNTWMAFIPVASAFLLGSVGDDINEKNGVQTPAPLKFIAVGLSAANLFLAGFIPVLGTLITVATYVAGVYLSYLVYNAYRPEKATLYTVFTAIPFTTFMRYIFFYMMRNDGEMENQFQGYYTPQSIPTSEPTTPPQEKNDTESM